MNKHFSSRPTGTENEDPFVLDDLVPDELELIAALCAHVKLGQGTKYSHAALNLMDKIEAYVNDPNYLQNACNNVNVDIAEYDRHGSRMAVLFDYFEIIV